MTTKQTDNQIKEYLERARMVFLEKYFEGTIPAGSEGVSYEEITEIAKMLQLEEHFNKMMKVTEEKLK